MMPFQTRYRRFHILSAALPAALLLLAGLGSAGIANASGIQRAEKKRVPVTYQVGDNCYGSAVSCSFDVTTAPGGKKRLEILGTSCRLQVFSPGTIHSATLRGPSGVPTYQYFEPKHISTYNGKNRFVINSTARYFVEKGIDLHITVSATEDLSQIVCSVLGEIVTYK